MSTVLDVRDLRVRFGSHLAAVRGVSFAVHEGETHCLVGESGCGKSLTALAIMGLLSRSATCEAERIALDGTDLSRLSRRQMARLSGDRIAMIFQDPMSSLNPSYTIGSQMAEGFLRHRGGPRRAALERAEMLLARVGISAPGARLGQFPHQLSGGLRQRVMIAMALMCEPRLLIADEPTTALDVTIQAQILRLLADLQREMGMSILLITHDLGIVARIADRVSVMYAGEVVETGATGAVFAAPEHPYTRGLLSCIPVPGRVAPGEPLGSIPGTVPKIAPGYAGCSFRERCDRAEPACAAPVPMHPSGEDHFVRCILPPGWPAGSAPSLAAGGVS